DQWEMVACASRVSCRGRRGLGRRGRRCRVAALPVGLQWKRSSKFSKDRRKLCVWNYRRRSISRQAAGAGRNGARRNDQVLERSKFPTGRISGGPVVVVARHRPIYISEVI